MSHFYAKIPNSARKNAATARGHKNTGITTQAASYAGAIEVDVWHNSETGKDEFRVCQILWHGGGIREEIASGVLGEETDPLSFAGNL